MFSQALVWAGEPGDEVLGIWHTTDDKALVEIFKKDNHFCAKIVSLKEPNWPANDKEGRGGKPKNDGRNPDLKQRSRTIAGIQFMSEFYPGRDQFLEERKDLRSRKRQDLQVQDEPHLDEPVGSPRLCGDSAVWPHGGVDEGEEGGIICAARDENVAWFCVGHWFAAKSIDFFWGGEKSKIYGACRNY